MLGDIREARRALVSVDKRPREDGERLQTRKPLEVSLLHVSDTSKILCINRPSLAHLFATLVSWILSVFLFLNFCLLFVCAF